MSSFLSFLSNRQIGGAQGKRGIHESSCKLDFDNQLSRLVNYTKDVYSTYIQNYPIPPFVCKFRKDRQSDLLSVANEEGEILLIDTERSKVLKSFIAHENAVFDICWLPDKNHMLTVSGDHSARLFDMNTCQFITSYHGHTASIKSVDACHTESAVFATGSRDGNICIWDRREKCGVKNTKPSNFISGAHGRHEYFKRRSYSYSSVSAVAFQDSIHLVSSGVADGLIKVWDLRRTYVRSRIYSPQYQMEYSSDKSAGHGCTSLVFDSSFKKLYGSITSNEIYQFDCHTYSDKTVVYSGLKCNTYFVKIDLSCDDQYLLSGSSNNKGYIWNTNKPGAPLYALCGHEAEVTSVAWCPYSITKLATVGDDQKLRVWKMRHSEDDDRDVENTAVSANCGDGKVSHFRVLVASFPPTPQCRRSNPKTPIIKSITNFFSPVTPSPSSSSASSSHHQDATPEKLTSPESQGLQSQNDSVLPQLRSPCKTMSDNDLVANADASTEVKSSPDGKENSTGDELSSSVKSTVQVKRKLSVHKPTICRYHPEGCGRTRGHTRCGKRINSRIIPDRHNIKNYFSVSSPE